MYIRTKDGVYEELDTTEQGVWTIYGDFIKNNEILNQADTIEELCDEFVGVDKTCENRHQLLRAIPYKCANFWNGGVYGAVWCEWGLKYVAKLDDKGELELI
jgi:hypothetical protein